MFTIKPPSKYAHYWKVSYKGKTVAMCYDLERAKWLCKRLNKK